MSKQCRKSGQKLLRAVVDVSVNVQRYCEFLCEISTDFTYAFVKRSANLRTTE